MDLTERNPPWWITKIVRGANTNDRKLTPYSEGLAAITAGFSVTSKDDYDNIAKQFPLYDALFGFCRSGHLESLLTSRHWLLWPLVDIMYKHIQHGLPGLNIWSTIPTYQGPFEGLHSWNVANLRSLARYCALYTFAYFFRAFVFYHQTLNKAKVKQEMFDFSLFEDFATRCFISYQQYKNQDYRVLNCIFYSWMHIAANHASWV